MTGGESQGTSRERPRGGKGSLLVGLLLSSRLRRGVLGAVLSLVLAALIIDYGDVPQAGLALGDVASRDVRAPQNLELVDQEATEQRRALAERSVRPVFDFDRSVAPSTTRRIRQAFALARGGTATDAAPAPEGSPGRTPESAEASPQPAAAPSKLAPGLAATPGPGDARAPGKSAGEGNSEEGATTSSPGIGRGSLSPALRERGALFEEALGVDLTDTHLNDLYVMHFDPALEAALVSILEAVLSESVIADRGMLPADLTSSGMTVIQLGGQQRTEEILYDAANILTVSEARRKVREQALERFASRPSFQIETLISLANRLIQPTLSYDAAQTSARREQARASVQPVTSLIRRGTTVVRAGDPIDAHKQAVLSALARAQAGYSPLKSFLSTAMLVGLLLTAIYLFAAAWIERFPTSMRDLATASVLLVVSGVLARVSVEIGSALSTHVSFIPLDSYRLAIPVAASIIVVRVLMSSEMAFIFAVVSSLLVTLVAGGNLYLLCFYLLSGLAAAGGIAHTRERVHVLRGGLLAAASNVLAALVIFGLEFSLSDARPMPQALGLPVNVLFAAVGGGASAILALGALPIFEAFGYLTDYKLLELANLNHPLLKGLMLHAPGTYHHSVIVGSLAEAAAQEIGADALLARVGSYYHDIGKVRKPEHFAENLRDLAENRHDRMDPHLSARIIAAHARDGIDLARQHRLPQDLIDLIPQHHGTALITYFYDKACRLAREGETVNEADFRYAGPRPRSKEAGIMMLADATEASSRSLKQANPARIRMNVHRIFQRVVADGQLDECPLTLKDLATIEEVFNRVLMGIYHNRVEYPSELRAGASMSAAATGAVLTFEQEAPREERPRPNVATLTQPRVTPPEATTTAENLPPPAPPRDAWVASAPTPRGDAPWSSVDTPAQGLTFATVETPVSPKAIPATAITGDHPTPTLPEHAISSAEVTLDPDRTAPAGPATSDASAGTTAPRAVPGALRLEPVGSEPPSPLNPGSRR